MTSVKNIKQPACKFSVGTFSSSVQLIIFIKVCYLYIDSHLILKMLKQLVKFHHAKPLGKCGFSCIRKTKGIIMDKLRTMTTDKPKMIFLNSIFSRRFWTLTRIFSGSSFCLVFYPHFSVLLFMNRRSFLVLWIFCKDF